MPGRSRRSLKYHGPFAREKRGAPAMALLAATLVGGLSGIYFLLA